MTNLATVTHLNALRTPPAQHRRGERAWLIAAFNLGVLVGLLAPYVDNIVHRIRRRHRA